MDTAKPMSQDELVKAGYLPAGASQAQYEYARDIQLKDANHAIQNAAMGLNPDGRAIDPGYQKANDLLNPNLQSKFNPDMQGIDAFRARALGPGPSPWATQMLGQQALEQQGQKNSLQQQSASSEAGARSALASKYGLSPAAQQRLALQNQRGQMSGLQDIGFKGAQARAQIGVQDEATKNQFLSALPGQELNLANANVANQQYNINNALKQNEDQNRFNVNKYNENMRAWAAGKTADAQANSGGGGGLTWLCSEISKADPISMEDWALLSDFKSYSLNHRRRITRFYLFKSKPLLKAMKDSNYDFSSDKEWLTELLKLIAENQMEDACDKYQMRFESLLQLHWKEGFEKLKEIIEDEKVFKTKISELLEEAHGS